MLTQQVRDFSRYGDAISVPNLIEIQIVSYARFLQLDKTPAERKAMGLEGLLREVFPIESYDGNMRLEYVEYALDEARYTSDECRELGLTYGMPFRVTVRLRRKDVEEVTEEAIFLGEIPIMIGGGEFIVNGSERVIVSQLHRSPGVDFVKESAEGDRALHACRIIPERGSWIEINVTRKDVLAIRIDLPTGDGREVRQHGVDRPGVLRDQVVARAEPQAGHVDRRPGRRSGDRRRAGGRGPAGGRGAQQDPRVLHQAGGRDREDDRPDHPEHAGGGRQPDARRGTTENLCPPAPREPRPARQGPQALPGEVLRREPLPPRQGRAVPPEPQVRAGHPRVGDGAAPRGLRQLAALRAGPARRRGTGRRHRPPGQPAAAHDRRVGVGRVAQGLPQAPAHRPGADEPEGAGFDRQDRGDREQQEHLERDRLLLRAQRAVAGRGPDQPAVAVDA